MRNDRGKKITAKIIKYTANCLENNRKEGLKGAERHKETHGPRKDMYHIFDWTDQPRHFFFCSKCYFISLVLGATKLTWRTYNIFWTHSNYTAFLKENQTCGCGSRRDMTHCKLSKWIFSYRQPFQTTQGLERTEIGSVFMMVVVTKSDAWPAVPLLRSFVKTDPVLKDFP